MTVQHPQGVRRNRRLPPPPNTFNDDITCELALLKAVEKHGKAITSADIAEQWVALANLKLGIFSPQSGYMPPCREWSGAQMRGVICGQPHPR